MFSSFSPFFWLIVLPLSLVQSTIYIPNPTWGNHTKIFTLAGLTVKTYRYYDPVTRGLNIQGLQKSLIYQ